MDHNKLWEILKEIEYQTTLPESWEICMQVKKQQLEPELEKRTGSKLGQGTSRTYIVTLLIYMQSTSWEMLGWMKHKLESRLLGEI